MDCLVRAPDQPSLVSSGKVIGGDLEDPPPGRRASRDGCESPQSRAEASRLVRELELERIHSLHDHVDQVRALFTRLVLRGESTAALREAAATRLGRPVSIEDDVAGAGGEPEAFAIVVGDREIGRVRVGSGAEPLSELETLIAREVATAAALLLLVDRSSARLGAMVAPRPDPIPACEVDWVQRWVSDLRLDDAHAYAAIAMTIDGAAHPFEVDALGRRALDRALQGRRLTAHVTSRGSEFVVLLRVGDRAKADVISRSLVDHLDSLVRLIGPGLRVTAGLGRLAATGSAAGQRIHEAVTACRLGRTLNGAGTRTAYLDLRAFPAMIEAVGGSQSASAFGELHERYLGSLLRYEQRTGLRLVQTLVALFDENGNVSGAARSLDINRQSLLYRLRKIETMCNVDLANPSDRFALELAVRAWIVRRALASHAERDPSSTCPVGATLTQSRRGRTAGVSPAVRSIAG